MNRDTDEPEPESGALPVRLVAIARIPPLTFAIGLFAVAGAGVSGRIESGSGTGRPNPPASGPDAPAIHESWPGISSTSCPPNPSCAAGIAHVGATVNGAIAFYTKDGTLVRGPTAPAAWWPDAPAGPDLFGLRIAYDAHAHRWLVLALNGRALDETYYALSVSKTSDPEGDWWTYNLRSDLDGSSNTDWWADEPGLGFDSGDATPSPTTGGAVYVTSNQYDRANPPAFQHAKIRVIPKHLIYTGAAAAWTDFIDPRNADGSQAFGVQPAVTDSPTPGGPIMHLLNSAAGGGDWLTLRSVTNPLTTPTVTPPRRIAVSAYAVPPPARQLGGSALLETGDCRVRDAQFRNGFLYTSLVETHDFGTPAGVESAIRYFKINAETGSVVWDARHGTDGVFSFAPNIRADANDAVTLAYARSSAVEYVGAWVTGRLSNEPVTQTGVELKAGDAYYDGCPGSGPGPRRWSAWTGLAADRAGDGRGVWVLGAYAQDAARWNTRLGGFSFGEPVSRYLTNGTTVGPASTNRHYGWRVSDGDWSGVIIAPAAGGDTDLAASDACPFGSPYARSQAAANVRDFIVANGAQFGAGFHQARVTHFSGPVGYRVQARTAPVELSVGAAVAGLVSGDDLLKMYAVPVETGKTYAAVLDILDGAADVDVFLFKGGRRHGARLDRDGSAQGAAAGPTGDETLVFTAAESTRHAIAVTNENDGNSNYSLRVWLRPRIADVPDAELDCGLAYLGPTPSLIDGTTPVTWSLTANPPGMTIDRGTGVLSWPAPTIAGSPHLIRVRATNPAGSHDESWTLTVRRQTPVIGDIVSAIHACGSPYSGPTPTVTQPGCMAPLTWTLAAGPPGMTIDANTGVVTWPTPTILGSPHPVTIHATNSSGSADESWTVTVLRIRPVIHEIVDATVSQCGAAYTGPTPGLTLPACMNPVAWSLVAGPPGMTISSFGVVSWPVTTAGAHAVAIRATNAAGSDDETWLINVAAAAPSIADIPDHQAPCGQPYAGPTPELTDPPCMTPDTWTLLTGPPGMSIGPDGVTAWPQPAIGTHAVTIRATNAGGSDDESWTVTIDPDAPLIGEILDATIGCGGMSYTGPTPVLTVPECMPPVTWSLVTGPAGMTIEAQTGVVTWSVTTIGSHPVTIAASNPAGADEESWTLHVTHAGGGPTINNQPADTTACAGWNATFSIIASGVGTLHYQWTKDGVPVGDDQPSLRLTGVQLEDDGAVITCEVTDDCGSASSVPATLAVRPTGGGDLNSDGRLDGADVPGFVAALLSSTAGTVSPEVCRSDMNADGRVDEQDVVIFVTDRL